MKTRKIQGTDIQAALREVRRTLGPDAVIMSTRETAEGIEVIAGTAPREVALPSPQTRTDTAAARRDALAKAAAQAAAKATARAAAKATAEATAKAAARAAAIAAAKQAALEAPTAPRRAATCAPTATTKRTEPRATPQAAEVSATRKRSEVSSGRKRGSRRGTPVQHPAFATLVSGLARPVTPPPPRPDVGAQLEALGIAGDVRAAIVESVKDVANEQVLESAYTDLQSRLHTTGAELLRTGGRIAVVGGTGVGKTTTIAKLAAHFTRLHGAESVALINADQYRIGASDQLRRFARLLGVPVVDVYTATELNTVLGKLADRKLVLVDTAGIAHGDARFDEQIELLGRSKLDCYLALSMNTQTAVLAAGVRAWSPLNPRGLIFTKEDEALSLGAALSMAVRHSLPVSFVTTGPNVPADIKVAHADKLVAHARSMLADELGAIDTNARSNAQANAQAKAQGGAV